MTELTERTEIVANGPALNHFAVIESEELHRRGANLLASWRHGIDLNIEVGQHADCVGSLALCVYRIRVGMCPAIAIIVLSLA